MKRSFVLSIASFLLMTEPIRTSDKKEASGIKFHAGSWEEALKQAKKEGKPIFLDISASWCGPCKMLKANTFSNIEVGEYYNTHFINVAVDGEEGEGIQLASKYRIRGYPTLLYLDSNGEIISHLSGYRDPQGFIELGKQIIN
jgi:thioredoxin 1